MIIFNDCLCDSATVGIPEIPIRCDCSGQAFAEGIKKLVNAEVEVVERNELHKFAVLHKRWIVESSFGWLEDYRLFMGKLREKILSTLQDTKMVFVSLLNRKYYTF